MARLAETAGTDLVIGARVVADRGSPPSYKLVVDRFDRDSPGTLHSEDAECRVCTEVEAAERLEQVAARLLPSMVVVQPGLLDVVAPTPVTMPPPAFVQENPHRKRNLALALGLTSLVAAGGIAMIVVGAHASSLDGHFVGGVSLANPQTPFLYDTSGTSTALITTGAVVLGGSLIAIALEAYSARSRRLP
ncbi:MAG: hypothetical protein ABI321_19765 [Polyangia bacterium]